MSVGRDVEVFVCCARCRARLAVVWVARGRVFQIHRPADLGPQGRAVWQVLLGWQAPPSAPDLAMPREGMFVNVVDSEAITFRCRRCGAAPHVEGGRAALGAAAVEAARRAPAGVDPVAFVFVEPRGHVVARPGATGCHAGRGDDADQHFRAPSAPASDRLQHRSGSVDHRSEHTQRPGGARTPRGRTTS